ncbi:MAG: DUF1015 domain-containing protein [Candidatus Omnitrophica bacterium]|nr:DUF1015 domain-containing protein [Candidatus Omnitrophota bacterium]
MVAVSPFRALRYNLQRVADLSTVIAPPYDVIDAEEQERLYQASPYNVVRLILGKQYSNDTEQENRYTRTSRDFSAWRQTGVLAAEPTPAFYLVEQTFRAGGRSATRLGFIALLELNERTPQDVFRHEATLSAPKADRTKLLEAVPANLEPIFCVYPDEGGLVQAALAKVVAEAAPDAEADSAGGDHLRFWVVTDAQVIAQLSRRLAPASVLIADGHHRFEVSMAHRARYGALMAYFVSMKDPALVVRPIHRVVTHPAPFEAAALRPWCTVEPAASMEEALAWLAGCAEPGRFALGDGTGWHRVAVTGELMAQWLMSPTVPLGVASLDVSILHGALLPRLGYSDVTYTAEAAKAATQASRAGRRSAWLLRGIPLEQVYALAAQGFTLSPKSTYFYPKVPSGLVIHPLV